MTEPSHDVERVAMCLYQAAGRLGKTHAVREVVRTALEAAAAGGPPVDGDPYAPDQLVPLMARFAAQWEQCETWARDPD